MGVTPPCQTSQGMMRFPGPVLWLCIPGHCLPSLIPAHTYTHPADEAVAAAVKGQEGLGGQLKGLERGGIHVLLVPGPFEQVQDGQDHHKFVHVNGGGAVQVGRHEGRLQHVVIHCITQLPGTRPQLVQGDLARGRDVKGAEHLGRPAEAVVQTVEGTWRAGGGTERCGRRHAAQPMDMRQRRGVSEHEETSLRSMLHWAGMTPARSVPSPAALTKVV